MTVSSEVSSVSYNGNGSTQIFAVPYYFLADTHLRVILRAADGTETVQAITTNYTVSGAGNPAGGSITMLVAPATGVTVVIIRNVPATQETDYVANDPFPAESHERALDKLTMLVQQGAFDVSRAIRVPDSDPEPALLPASIDRANKLFAFDALGNPSVEAINPGDSEGLAVLLANNTDPAYGAGMIGFKGRTVYTKLLESFPSVVDYGAKLDGVTNDLPAFQAALAAHDVVYFPPGQAKLLDKLTIPNGKTLFGAGVQDSVFVISSDFNLAATGVVQLGTSESVTTIDNIGFEFTQPDSAVRGDMIQYPYAITHAGIPRARIGRVRISRGWNGINASGNAGGAVYDFIECGTLNIGLNIDGALDTMNIGRFRVWPFGMSAAAGPGLVYRDDTTRAAVIGRCDGLAGELQSFRAEVHFTNTGASSPSRHLTTLHLDGDGARLRLQSGPLDIDFLYSTKSSVVGARPEILLDGDSTSRLKVANIDIASDAGNTDCILVNAGSLSILGGRINRLGAARRAVYVQGGSCSIRGTELTAPGARSVAYVRADAGELIVQDCNFTANGGTGDGINTTASGVTGYISGVALNGRKLNITAGSMLGMITQPVGGTFTGDATTSVILPAGWSINRLAAGNYAITHNLGWAVNRTILIAIARTNGTPIPTVVHDTTNSTVNQVRIRTYISGALADTDVAFKLDHT